MVKHFTFSFPFHSRPTHILPLTFSVLLPLSIFHLSHSLTNAHPLTGTTDRCPPTNWRPPIDWRLPTYHCPPTNWHHWSIFSSISHSLWIRRQSWVFGSYLISPSLGEIFRLCYFFIFFFGFSIWVCGNFSWFSDLDFCLMVIVFWVVSSGLMVGCNFGGCLLNSLWCFDGCFLNCLWWFGVWWCFGGHFFSSNVEFWVVGGVVYAPGKF